MATISSMLRGTYLMYKYNQKNGSSVFNSSRSSINSLWSNNSTKSASSAASSTMSGLLGVRSSLNDMVKDYNATKKTFYTEFNETINDLKKSTANLQKMDFNVGADALQITQTVNEDGTTSTVLNKSDKLTDVMKGVEDFVTNYNDAIKFFSDNASVSKHVKNLSSIFADTNYSAKSAANIGIKINSDGKMEIDEEKLAKSISENPTRTDAVLSTLANKSERHISFAKAQQNRLFPSMSTMLGGSFKSASVYSGNSLMRISNYSMTGSLLNFFI